MRYTVDTIAGLAFGAEVNTLESDGDVIQQHLDKIFPALLQRMLAPLADLARVPSRPTAQLAHGVEAVNEAVDGIHRRKRARRMAADPTLRTHPRNLLEAMIAAADEPGSGITDLQVAGNVMTMLLAGEDTTANTIAWMIDLLWRHPAALARATDEVRRVCSATRAARPSSRWAQLDYVEACAHETMRLKPVAPILGLQAERDTRGRRCAGAGGHGDVQPDAPSTASATATCPTPLPSSRSAGSPTAAAGAVASSAKRTSMPFGAGPRICPGRYLALLEMKMAMAHAAEPLRHRQRSTRPMASRRASFLPSR